MNREVVANQRMAETLLKAASVPFETVDGSDPARKAQRDGLFALSQLRGTYPQFFRIRPGDDGTATTFVGDWAFVQSSNECGTLLRDLLGTAGGGTDLPSTAAVDVWSSNLKNHVTVDPDGPAVLDVSIDDVHSSSAAAGTLSPPPKPSNRSISTPVPTKQEGGTAAAAVPESTPEEAEVVVAQKTMMAAMAPPPPLHKPRDDKIIDLSAPASDEVLQDQKDCQCIVL
jgi:hypothetical protein